MIYLVVDVGDVLSETWLPKQQKNNGEIVRVILFFQWDSTPRKKELLQLEAKNTVSK